MKIPCLLLTGSLVFASASVSSGADAKKDSPKAWTDPESAASEDPDFEWQGEYGGTDRGIQVAALGEGKFYVTKFSGGLPEDGWDGKQPETAVVERAELTSWMEGLKKKKRVSPTLGAKPPEGAVVLFNGEANDKIKGEAEEKVKAALDEFAADFA